VLFSSSLCPPGGSPERTSRGLHRQGLEQRGRGQHRPGTTADASGYLCQTAPQEDATATGQPADYAGSPLEHCVGPGVLARWLTGGTAGMAVALAAIAVVFAAGGDQLHSASAVIAIAVLALYPGSFAIGLGPVFWLLIRPPSPLRPAAPPGLLSPRWGRTVRDPPAGRHRATSSSRSAPRTSAALRPACLPARAPAPAGRGSARRPVN